MKKKVIIARHSHFNVELEVEGKDLAIINDKAFEQAYNIDFIRDGKEEQGSVEYEILHMEDIP